jgi:hypothetical protein
MWSMRSMRFQSSVVMEVLQRLEREFGAPRGHVAQVAADLSGGRIKPARDAADQLLRSLDLVVAMTTRLHANVIPIDELGATNESTGELALRARRMVILTQLGQLRDVLREPAAEQRARPWFVGQFASIHDVATFFHDELHKINGIWTRYRANHPDAAGMSKADRATLYRVAVRVAQRALHELQDQPDVAYFLRVGLAADDWADVHTPLSEIAAALAVQIDVESGRTPVVPRPPSMAEGTPARKP